MTADLRQVNATPSRRLTPTQFSTKLTQTIARLYVFTLVMVSIGTCFALYQNWDIRMNAATSRLVRSADMGNFLVETALASAAKSLDNTQAIFNKALQGGSIEPKLASQLLNMSYANFKKYNKADAFGLIFFVDRQGFLFAQSGKATDRNIDFSDRFYFYHLRDNPDIKRAIGPLLIARTTGQWVFHMSVPVHDKDGKFAGVLVQQILEDDIAQKLTQYADIDNFEQMITHVEANDPSFVYPPPDATHTPSTVFLQALTHKKIHSTSAGGTFDWDASQQGFSNHLLMGFAQTSTFNLQTYATFPLAKVRQDFWFGNVYLMIYAIFGIFFVTAIFYYLLNLSKQLMHAQVESLHDPLTKIHNRRALDEIFPSLMRDAMRSQEPISVLFIDIDNFRYFNENYGHESGDIALNAVAQTLESCARRPLDFVCRWGGEEFVIVLPHTNAVSAEHIAQRVLNAVRAIELQSSHDGQKARLTVSVGHVTSVITADPVQEDLIDEADKAMLQAKCQGRDQCSAYAKIC
jgi:diguanylate cyclase (GGDEF)-like protein